MSTNDVLMILWLGGAIVSGPVMREEAESPARLRRLMGPHELDIPGAVWDELIRDQLIRERRFWGGQSWPITDAGLARIGKPTAQQMKRVEVVGRDIRRVR